MAEDKEIIKYLEKLDKRFDELTSFMKEEFASVRGEIVADREEAKGEFAAVRKEIKEEVAGLKEEFALQTGILMEDSQHKFEILAEGIRGSNEKLSREKEEHRQAHESIEKRLLLHDADISRLNQKVGLG